MCRMILIVAGIVVVSAGLTGCAEKSEPPQREPQGRRIKVDAPYAHIDIFIPEDE